MRIYVASRFRQYARVRLLIDALRDAGHTITHDWTRTDQFDLLTGEPYHAKEEELPKSKLQEYALADLRGVRTADLVVFLADELGFGAPVEVGAALALGITVYVVDPIVYTVFWDHPLVTVFDNEDYVRESLGAVL